MARIRSIKPEFWRDEELSEVSAEAALLAIGLLNHADDEGYFKANPKLVDSDIFPLRELSRTCTVLLQELSEIGYIELFTGSDGKKYGFVCNFTEHQVINKLKHSKIKGLRTNNEEYGTDTVLVPIGKEGKGTGKGKEGKGTYVKPQAVLTEVMDVFDFWKFKLNHPQSKLDDKRKKAIGKALKIGYTVEELKNAVLGCSMSDYHMGINDKRTRYDSIDLIFRSADHIDKFVGVFNQGGASAGKGAELDAIGDKAIAAFLDTGNTIEAEVMHDRH